MRWDDINHNFSKRCMKNHNTKVRSVTRQSSKLRVGYFAGCEKSYTGNFFTNYPRWKIVVTYSGFNNPYHKFGSKPAISDQS